MEVANAWKMGRLFWSNEHDQDNIGGVNVNLLPTIMITAILLFVLFGIMGLPVFNILANSAGTFARVYSIPFPAFRNVNPVTDDPIFLDRSISEFQQKVSMLQEPASSGNMVGRESGGHHRGFGPGY